MSNNITFSEWSTRREILSYFSTIPYRIAENEPNDYDKYQRPSRNGIGYVAICPGERGNNFYTDDTITVAYLKKKYEKFLKNSHI